MTRRRTGPAPAAVLVVVLLAAACDAGADVAAPRTPSPVPVASSPSAEPAPVTPPSTSPEAAPTSPLAVPGEAFPTQPAGVAFPTDAWEEGPWPQGVDRSAVDEAVESGFSDGRSGRVRAVLVVHGGRLVYERYSPDERDTADQRMPSYSVAKSVTSALVGTLVRDGRLDVHAPASVPEWEGDDPRTAITIDHLVRMTSGLAWAEEPYPTAGDLTAMIASSDAAAYVAARELEHEPGTEFEYSSGNTTLLARILGDAVGGPDALDAYIEGELLDRMGVEMRRLSDPAGTWYGGFSADATARDLAKFGLLYVRDGIWEGHRILPEGWVEYSRTPTEANPEYGAGWWLDLERPGVFYALGLGGQVIGVDPAHDLVFVHTATAPDLALPVAEAVLDAFSAADA